MIFFLKIWDVEYLFSPIASTEDKDNLKVMDKQMRCSTDKDCNECAVCVDTPTLGRVCIGCEGEIDHWDSIRFCSA